MIHLALFFSNVTFLKKLEENSIAKTVCIEQNIIDSIKRSLYTVRILIERVLPNPKEFKDKEIGFRQRYSNAVSRQYNRMFSPGFYSQQLLKELNILNGYFIIYESKFNRIVQLYEFVLEPSAVQDIRRELYEKEKYLQYINKASIVDIKGKVITEAESNLERLNTFNNNVNEYVETVNESLIPKGTNEGKGGKRSRRTRIKKRKKAKKTRKRTLL